MITASADILVEFFDVDAMKVVWHGNYARFLEIGRNALLEKLGFGYTAMEASGFSWPVVDLHIRYVQPARLGQRLRVTATLVEWENRVRMEFLIHDAVTGEKITKADSVQVAVDMRTGELQFETPEVFASKIRSALK
ncbi:MAG: thioesterase superfamily protein [Fibrobacteres bacterium]|nr:thioesterase superfamily protein [Fibrobacterota bacterium]